MDKKLFACIQYLLASQIEILTRKKLELLLYYAYCWYMTINADKISQIKKSKLFETKFEAGVNGPTIPHFDDIMLQQLFIDTQYELNYDEIDILDQILKIYGHFTEHQLIKRAQSEKPWIEARNHAKCLDECHNVLIDTTIYKYYMSKIGR